MKPNDNKAQAPVPHLVGRDCNFDKIIISIYYDWKEPK
jgi:hypothetical protein